MAKHLYRRVKEIVTQEDLLKKQDTVLIGYKEICAYMRFSPDTLRKWVRKNHFPVAMINKKAYTTRSLIDQYFMSIADIQFQANRKNGGNDADEEANRENCGNEQTK